MHIQQYFILVTLGCCVFLGCSSEKTVCSKYGGGPSLAYWDYCENNKFYKVECQAQETSDQQVCQCFVQESKKKIFESTFNGVDWEMDRVTQIANDNCGWQLRLELPY